MENVSFAFKERWRRLFNIRLGLALVQFNSFLLQYQDTELTSFSPQQQMATKAGTDSEGFKMPAAPPPKKKRGQNLRKSSSVIFTLA